MTCKDIDSFRELLIVETYLAAKLMRDQVLLSPHQKSQMGSFTNQTWPQQTPLVWPTLGFYFNFIF